MRQCLSFTSSFCLWRVPLPGPPLKGEGMAAPSPLEGEGRGEGGISKRAATTSANGCVADAVCEHWLSDAPRFISGTFMSFDATEKYQSQIPALQLLVALGFRPLSGTEALALRGGRLRNVVLDEVLTEQLLRPQPVHPSRPRVCL